MMNSTQQIRKRTEIPTEECWNVEALYPNFETWEKAFLSISKETTRPRWPQLAIFRGRLQEGPEILKDLLETLFFLSREIEKIHTYAHLRHDEDTINDKYKSAFQRIMTLAYDFQEESSWINPELLSLDSSTIERYLNSPILSPYRFFIEKIVRMRPHTLTADKEQLLAMAGKPLQVASKAFNALNNADIKFGVVKDHTGKEFPLTHGLYQLYLRSPDRTLREEAFKKMHTQFLQMENTLAELLYGEIQNHSFNANARNFPSSLEAAIFPKDIPQSVYRSLIHAVREGLPLLHRYVSLRKKILHLPQIHLYDMYVPLVPEADITMSYPEAEEVVIESVAPLGKEYQMLLREGLKQQRWVDRFENQNKRSGAYSSGCYDSFPYILMNYSGILRDVFTLAHEAGHSMHSYLSKDHQPYHYSQYPIFVAEVASTFNEELLMDYLLKKTTQKEKRLFLINEKIEDIRATLFRQTMFAEFELKIHELVENGTPLTPTLLKEIYTQLNRDYFGPEVVIDEEASIEWARIPHFYYNFYVYQYATGISAALSLAEKVLSNKENARENYLSFLKGGSSHFPIDLLKLAGIDMTTSLPVQAALRKFEALLDEIESLVK